LPSMLTGLYLLRFMQQQRQKPQPVPVTIYKD
jgi:hypothetical protein